MNDEAERALALLSEADGVSEHETAARTITDAAARRVRNGRVHELSLQGRSRYTALFDRLAQ
ncbi:CopG family transcriptional regulator [Streptomyces sp. AA4]|uniref:CopG family transcriptional regulator n=1 Tax=Actinomycetes TaxID=1760 RepID=UPI000302AEB2|nr:CopG family transcriptional regulator [Streptomyces sp. AA4]